MDKKCVQDNKKTVNLKKTKQDYFEREILNSGQKS